MLARMKGRAPDGHETRCEGPVAFGNAFLRTGTSNAESPHPISLDGQVWLTADARIDGRGELIRSIRAAGRRISADAPHAELILHAYHCFGEAFLERLIGDFAFALWDWRLQKLICGRDHFGVRPFHYFESGDLFGFASCADALVVHPVISNELDEISVADFLMFSSFQDPSRSIYRDVRCLPPATSMHITVERSTLHKYWDVPNNAEVRFTKPAEYVQQFQQLFHEAVLDRLPQAPVALQLSGGLDSAAIAAVTTERSRQTGHAATAYNV